jgi:hypothetical protein
MSTTAKQAPRKPRRRSKIERKIQQDQKPKPLKRYAALIITTPEPVFPRPPRSIRSTTTPHAQTTIVVINPEAA